MQRSKLYRKFAPLLINLLICKEACLPDLCPGIRKVNSFQSTIVGYSKGELSITDPGFFPLIRI